MKLNKYIPLGVIAILIAAMLLATPAATTNAAPPAQVPEAETTNPFAEDREVQRQGVLALMGQAAGTVRYTLRVVNADPGVEFQETGFGLSGVLEQQRFGLEEEEQANLREFQILQPSSQVALQTAAEVLAIISEGLNNYELINEQDVAEELVFQRGLLGQLELEEEEEGGVIEEESANVTPPGQLGEAGSPLDRLDIEVGLVSGECGDLDTLVRAARRDVLRALGFFPGQGQVEVNPDARLLALDALFAHYIEMRQAVECLRTTIE